ncbi:SocA family protein [Fertoebacter nigrum]|uniref:SocA family protein n=1 Tax=Fertoeibacter niger TaxID=2656921 RepID=A0A8X8H263_9RHOB|nr:type II toxin-antitoxin system antitoxin SocA domain-containing protein [Fertoeibacter niger]NUB44909.1 SocA family protein [Fertoeibacter niger]
MAYSAITIADQILRIAKGKGQMLTPLQLMKLVYIAHGWSFPLRGSDLFENRIEAWKYGPVIPDLYHATKRFGREQIGFDFVGSPDEPVVDAQTKGFLENVFNAYGHMSGIALSSLTHQSGTPWQQVYQEGVYNKAIPDQLIKQHYDELHRVRRSAAA